MADPRLALRRFGHALAGLTCAMSLLACSASDDSKGTDQTAPVGGGASSGNGGQLAMGSGAPGASQAGRESGGAGGSSNAGAGGSSPAGAAGRSTGGGDPGSGDEPALLPQASEECPTIRTGNLSFLGQTVKVWAGAPSTSSKGPLVIYWHATGGVPEEAVSGLGQAAIDEIIAAGGMVAAQAQTTGQGTNTGNSVWFTGDFEVADEIVACAIEQLQIDTRRIYASGFSAGGLQTAWMAYERSGYLASVVPYSGGLTGLAGFVLTPIKMPQDPSNVPAAMAVHGRAGADVVVLDFAVQSRAYLDDVKAKGGFGIECDHGGGHLIPDDIAASAWQFLKAHPFGTKPSPYAAGLPASFPAYCKSH